jgi:hypothetical protein
MSTPDQHDIESYAIGDKVSVRCLTHDTDTMEQWNSVRDAIRDFACDGGLGLRFIIETEAGIHDSTVVVMRDLSGLARAVHNAVEARTYGWDDTPTRAWLWLGDGRTEPLDLKPAGMSDYDEDDYAVVTTNVTGADGRVIIAVRVRIDGRS